MNMNELSVFCVCFVYVLQRDRPWCECGVMLCGSVGEKYSLTVATSECERKSERSRSVKGHLHLGKFISRLTTFSWKYRGKEGMGE